MKRSTQDSYLNYKEKGLQVKIYAFDKAKNKSVVAGHIDGDTFVRKVQRKHFMRFKNGYGIQESVMQELVMRGVTKILLIAEHDRWLSDISDWLLLSPADYGHGKQRFLDVKKMKNLQGELEL